MSGMEGLDDEYCGTGGNHDMAISYKTLFIWEGIFGHAAATRYTV